MSARGRGSGAGGGTKSGSGGHNQGSGRGGHSQSSNRGGGHNQSSGRGGGQNQSSGRGGGQNQSSGRGGGHNHGSSRGGGGHSHSSDRGGGHNHGSGRGGGGHSHSSDRGGGHNHGSGRGGGHNQSSGRGGGHNHGPVRGGHNHSSDRSGSHSHSSSPSGEHGNVKHVNVSKGGSHDKKHHKDSRGNGSLVNIYTTPHTSGFQHNKSSSKPVKHIYVQPVVNICPPVVVQYPHYENPGSSYQEPLRNTNPPRSQPMNRPSAPSPYCNSYPAPPPSYDEAIEDDQPPNFNNSNSNLTVEALVKALAIFNGQFGTAESLARQVAVHCNVVINLAKSRKDLFAFMGEGKDTVIELVPKIALCSDFLSSDGCNDLQTCEDLHICKTYVTEFCKMQPCQYGHRWDTTHNSAILSKFYLDLINHKTLHQVLKKVCKDSSKLKICTFYNNEKGCRYDEKCWQLHICKNFLLGKCSNEDCSLNHDILAHQCTKILKRSGVSVNETPKDVLQYVLSLTNIQLEKNMAPSSRNKTKYQVKKEHETEIESVSKEKEKPVNENSQDENSDAESSDDSQSTTPESLPEKKIRKKMSNNKFMTIKSTDVLGDVDIPEICVFSLDDKCKNFKKGCRYLHAKSLFHWQAEKEGKWYNLRIFQSKTLETAYRDVTKCNVGVPALEENKLEESAKELLNVLGTSPWNADLRTMTMTSNKLQLHIRRVSTQSSVLSRNPKATVFSWYFQDLKGKWIQYGQVDSLGKQELVFNMTSEDIEKQYLSDPASSMLVSNSKFKCTLDFSKMIQTNEETREECEVRRRPSRLLYQKKSVEEHTPNPAFPSHWTPMTADQPFLLIPVELDSSEYKEVSGRLRLTLPKATIVKIDRLQNPYLWRLLQNKEASLSERYGENQLNMQKLFYGTNPLSIDTICKENIDWRQGKTYKQTYGQGTYFHNSAASVSNHCIKSDTGHFFVLLAHVIIGMVTEGDESLTSPPVNPVTCSPFNTTVDNENTPTIFVKYVKDEYYPEYIIEFYCI